MTAKVGMRGTVKERFERFTIPEPNSGCLLWIGACDSNGYGQLRIAKKAVRATYIALQLAGRPLPEGLRALHTCDNPYCVNADHLFSGKQIDNVADMISKDRHDFSGLKFGHGANRTSEKTLAHIRQLFEQGLGPAAIARIVQVSSTTVLNWMKVWGHISVHQSERTHCPQGHPYSGDNLYRAPRGDRICRMCKRASDRMRRHAAA